MAKEARVYHGEKTLSSISGVRECSNFTLLHVIVQFFQHHLLKTVSFLHGILLPPLPYVNWPLVHSKRASLKALEIKFKGRNDINTALFQIFIWGDFDEFKPEILFISGTKPLI